MNIPPKLHKIEDIRFLTDNTFIIRMERDGLEFKAGQYITVGLKDSTAKEYSIYSGEKDPYLEILVMEVYDPEVSRQLRNSKPGQLLEVNGPLGFFKLNTENPGKKKLMFIATGTGISPFHSFIKSYNGLNYTVVHGVRYFHEAYESGFYDQKRLILCTTGDDKGGYHGRVTDFLREQPLRRDMEFYLCGNSRMIDEAYGILISKQMPVDLIHSEPYF